MNLGSVKDKVFDFLAEHEDVVTIVCGGIAGGAVTFIGYKLGRAAMMVDIIDRMNISAARGELRMRDDFEKLQDAGTMLAHLGVKI